MHSVILEPTKLILAGTRTTYQATGGGRLHSEGAFCHDLTVRDTRRFAQEGKLFIMRSGQRSIIEYIVFYDNHIVVTHCRLDNAKSPTAMLQEKTARTPHTFRIAGGSALYARSHAVRTYIPQVGYLLLFLMLSNCCMKRENTARHSSIAAKTVKMKQNFGKKKKSPSPRVIVFCLIGTPGTGQNIKKKKTNSRASFSASYTARPSG